MGWLGSISVTACFVERTTSDQPTGVFDRHIKIQLLVLICVGLRCHILLHTLSAFFVPLICFPLDLSVSSSASNVRFLLCQCCRCLTTNPKCFYVSEISSILFNTHRLVSNKVMLINNLL